MAYNAGQPGLYFLHGTLFAGRVHSSGLDPAEETCHQYHRRSRSKLHPPLSCVIYPAGLCWEGRDGSTPTPPPTPGQVRLVSSLPPKAEVALQAWFLSSSSFFLRELSDLRFKRKEREEEKKEKGIERPSGV